MEPAGSHGVWSLDDFQFLPFLIGSVQFYSNNFAFPLYIFSFFCVFFKSFLSCTSTDKPLYNTGCYLDPNLVARTKDDYLWMGSIDFISKVKFGPFAEHSNQLWNISAVTSWEKIYGGLQKKYEAEVSRTTFS